MGAEGSKLFPRVSPTPIGSTYQREGSYKRVGHDGAVSGMAGRFREAESREEKSSLDLTARMGLGGSVWKSYNRDNYLGQDPPPYLTTVTPLSLCPRDSQPRPGALGRGHRGLCR